MNIKKSHPILSSLRPSQHSTYIGKQSTYLLKERGNEEELANRKLEDGEEERNRFVCT